MKPSLAYTILEFLKSHDAMDQLPDLVKTLQHELHRSQEIVVISAQPLSKEEQATVSTATIAHWGEHPVRFLEDATLISGSIFTFGSQVIDRSGKGAMHDLATSLTSNVN